MKYSAKTSKKGRAKKVTKRVSKKRSARKPAPKKRVVKRRPQKIIFVSKPSSVSESKPETSSVLILSLIGLLIVGIGVGVYFLLRDEKQPEPKKRYSCNSTTKQCEENPNGEYDSLDDCNSHCHAIIRYKCDNDPTNPSCVPTDEGGEGTFETLEKCKLSCHRRFSCSGKEGNFKCSQNNISGTFNDIDSCNTSCAKDKEEYEKQKNREMWKTIGIGIGIIIAFIVFIGIIYFLPNWLASEPKKSRKPSNSNISGGIELQTIPIPKGSSSSKGSSIPKGSTRQFFDPLELKIIN